ncbi:MAG: efflux RND transporter periplasmic adaptor subunit [Candidatus Omnitrophica bacterium]|nr:efflux RND transporter periplasmic adaptor subunit [Candidatus Omnitrophota bacterium]
MNPRRRLLLVGIGTILLVGSLSFVTGRLSLVTHQSPERGGYYCPMHPTYTSDKPGDCPICGMRLVKRAPQAAGSAQPSQARLQDLCYMHHCPMIKPGQRCPMLVMAKKGEAVSCPICGTHVAEAAQPSARNILYWTDPMIPGYKSDKPGKSPMGMDLVPVYEEEAGLGAAASADGHAPVLIAPQKQQLIGVRTAPAHTRRMTKTIRTVGAIAHDPELYQAEQELIQARQSWERAAAGQNPDVADQAKQLLESSHLRLRHLGLSQEMIDEIATWTEPDHRLLVGGGGEYWVYVSVYEYELPLVKKEQAVTIDVSALPGRTFAGVVKAIDPIVEPATRTSRSRILVNDPGGLLRPGMYVNAAIAVELGEVVAVPEEAVFSTGEQQIVFVDKGQGVFEPRDVALGEKGDGFVEIRHGVAPGELVVTSGNFLIDSESRLKAALEDMSAAPAKTPSEPSPSEPARRNNQ